MSIATEHEPFNIECPWCLSSVGPEYNEIVLVNFKLTDFGRSRLESYSCPFCSQLVGFIVKNVAYRIVRMPTPVEPLLLNPEESGSMTSKLADALVSSLAKSDV